MKLFAQKKKMIIDFYNNKPCPESATSFNAYIFFIAYGVFISS